jgi:predicted Ser/Thr protein kinase
MSAVTQPESLGNMRHYVLLEEIGRGAHGTVYRARDTERQQDVALKVVEDNSSVDRLLLEPQLLSKLHHPNIVALRDYFFHGGKVVIAMEYISGPDLENWTAQRGPLTAADVRKFLTQISSALATAHAAGIFHSDIKPKNILVDTSGASPRFVIVDFGVSRMTSGIQLTKYVAGTCSFMAPEQLRGRGTMQSDLWALGTLAYLLLTGERPFPARTMNELRREILYNEPIMPMHLAAEDAALESIIVRLLEKNTVERTQSAAQLLGELSSNTIREVEPVEGSISADKSPQWEASLQKEIKRRKTRIAIWATLGSLPDPIAGPMGFFGAWLIYRGQTQRRSGTTAAGVAIVLLAFTIALLIGAAVGEELANAFYVISALFSFFFFGAASNFLKLRAAQRELTLLRTLRMSDRDQMLAVLQQYVSCVPGDMNIRRRFMEGLMAAGRYDEAAVEAQLMLKIDPYNIPATLLLAHSYLELGLHERCEQVCNGYLEVAGQCFEFEDLLSVAKSKVAA